ncbi:MAG: BlaI/MecI/CopY family transcriptional regulator [Phycisphaerae bacterium]|nr:BlaI/MecI/CopY family transcriptional regulator [Phycisphaerae bacterium]NIP55481.1 BlaI/MecI/CopY family transcriptional regulator [Phycisphaerae bacterium]NIS54186.1 BlaI/MecI/CopY family transcriptional regulator [Phycisphaerae bacterium]NIU11790.1 BlaI/MecI/CopY family transcriptional regulator [Phycisphaerae bacterium]NIU59613.1 BlaI/MecI/CopY family transcriptional regulator [Phycisphaerae bacterium]
MPKKKLSEIRLGRLEMQIMNVVWDKGQATVHDVKDVISRGRKPAYSTILTMMRKLEAKGYLSHDVDERTYVYRATISRQTVRQGVIGDLLDRLFEGSPLLLLNSLVEQNRISEEELREIRKLISKRRR